jgi:hypothetical protein
MDAQPAAAIRSTGTTAAEFEAELRPFGPQVPIYLATY